MNKKKLLYGSAAVAAGGAAMLLLRSRPRIDLRGKVVLITGGTKGLGIAMAREFAARGSHLVLCARSEPELERAARDLRGSLGRVMTLVCDVTEQNQVRETIAKVVGEFGRLDVLVNNAGKIAVGPVHTMKEGDFKEAMDVMFWGMVYMTLAALPHLRKSEGGRIVNITSVGGKVAIPHLLPYSCAKFAAVGFSEGMRAELHGSGVKVVTIAPGLLRTGSFLNAFFKGAEKGEAGWFALAASLPGISMGAKRAARQIVEAVEQGRSERILSTPANLLARLHGLAPEASTAVLGWVARLLPNGSRRNEFGRTSELLRRPWMQALTYLGRRAAEELLQPTRG